MGLELLAPSWAQIQKSCLRIAEMIESNRFKPETVVGIARGGWIPARILVDLLGVNELTNLGISFYSDIASTKKTPVIHQPVSSDLKGKVVLVVDDVADTGRSLKIGRDHILGLKPKKLKIATIYRKPWSIITPDYYTSETDAWIIFPWEQAESTRSLKKKLAEEGLSKQGIKRKLLQAGLERAVVEAAMR